MKILILLVFLVLNMNLFAEDVSLIYKIQNQTIGSNPHNLITFHGKQYFLASKNFNKIDPINKYQIWSCDSNENVILEISLYENPLLLFELNDYLYILTGTNRSKYNKLWRYDGVNSPRLLYSDIFDIGKFMIYGGKMYYNENDCSNNDSIVWIFDGINRPKRFAATYIQFDYENNPESAIYQNKLYFAAYDPIYGHELWCFDFINPPSLVADINKGFGKSNPTNLSVHDNKLYFMADDGIHGLELWFYDGVNEPNLLADINPGEESSMFNYKFSATTYKNKFYFRANDGIHDHRLWSYDGTNPPQMVDSSDNIGFPAGMFLFKDKLYYLGYDISRLYEYDGTGIPKPVVNSKVYNWDDYIVFDDILFFYAKNKSNQIEIWKYDGINTTINLAQSLPASYLNSGSNYLFTFNNKLYFNLSSSLFKYVDDSLVFVSSEFPISVTQKNEFNGKLYYVLSDYSYNPGQVFGSEVWSFDGTNPPKIVADINDNMIIPESSKLKEKENKLFFTYTDNDEKYVSYDNENFEILPSSFNPKSLYNLLDYNNNYYYISDCGKICIGLIKSDGINTTVISSASDDGGLAVLNNKIYFGVKGNLYRYDEINTPECVAKYTGRIVYLQEFNNKLVFFTTSSSIDFVRFYQYDEEDSVSLLNETLDLGTSRQVIFKSTVYNSKLYYAASDSLHGTELWVYDGIHSPSIVADILSGTGNSNPSELSNYNGKLYFAANDSVFGTELWKYNGTDAPQIVADILEGPSSSSPEQLSVNRNKLYFSAYTELYGKELWAYDEINKPYLVSDINKGWQSSDPNDLTVYKDNLYLSAILKDEGRQLFRVCYSCSSIDTVVCTKYNFNGKMLNASGRYYDTIPLNSYIDSIVKLDLSIVRPLATVINVETCNYYEFSGRYLTVTGIYSDTIPNAAGCDSIITINLTIKNSSTSSINETVCESYTTPGGKVWTTSGEYKDTIPNATGWDSIITINLTVNHSTSATIQLKACGSYTSPSGKYTWDQSGTYLDTIPNASGCDSVITIELNVIDIDPSVIQDRNVIISKDELAHHQWIDCDNGYLPIEGETYLTYTANKSGNYAVIVSYGWCSDTSECVSIHITDLSPNPSESGILLYPNPTNGRFTVKLGRVYEEATITITKLDGRIIQKKLVGGEQIIDLEMTSPAGIYVVTITTSKESAVFRIMKN